MSLAPGLGGCSTSGCPPREVRDVRPAAAAVGARRPVRDQSAGSSKALMLALSPSAWEQAGRRAALSAAQRAGAQAWVPASRVLPRVWLSSGFLGLRKRVLAFVPRTPRSRTRTRPPWLGCGTSWQRECRTTPRCPPGYARRCPAEAAGRPPPTVSFAEPGVRNVRHVRHVRHIRDPGPRSGRERPEAPRPLPQAACQPATAPRCRPAAAAPAAPAARTGPACPSCPPCPSACRPAAPPWSRAWVRA